jgi:hypothetical protein
MTFVFVMSVRLLVRMEQFDSHQKDFPEIWFFTIFLKSVEKIQVSLKSDRITGTLDEPQYTFSITSRSFLRMRNVSDIVTEKVKIKFHFNNFFFSKIVPVMRSYRKILQSRACHKWQKVHARCMLDT